MTELYAQPYDVSATGFYFTKPSEYAFAASSNKNAAGDPVEEYEIQFIDGEAIDCALARVWGLNQANVAEFLEAVDDWDEDDKHRYIIAVGECGYSHDELARAPERIDLQLYALSSMRELAEQFVEEGLFGEIPERLQFYIDFDAIARDLAIDYSEVTIAGTHFIFHCA